MKIKTYGINGLTEWHGDVKAGTISVRVSFTGGTASPSGAQPAYFVTKDPITQFVIENSKEFKSGFIHLEMSHDLPGQHPRMAVQKVEPAPVSDGRKDVNRGKDVSDGAEGQQGGPGADASDTVEEKGEAGDAPMKISVGSKTEAVEWLKDHYPDKGYNGFTLKGKDAFAAACQECGVEFEF